VFLIAAFRCRLVLFLTVSNSVLTIILIIPWTGLHLTHLSLVGLVVCTT